MTLASRFRILFSKEKSALWNNQEAPATGLEKKLSDIDIRLQKIFVPNQLISLSRLWRYAAAFLIIVVSTGIRLALIPSLGINTPYSIAGLAVVLSTMLLGFGPGLLVVFVGDFAVEWIIIGSWDLNFESFSLLRYSILVSIGVLVCYILHTIRTAHDIARIKTDTASDEIRIRKQAEDALRSSEENYRLLLQHAPSAIYEIDFRIPRFRRVNDAMCRLTGYTREELLKMDPADFMDEKSKELFRERIRRLLNGEQTDTTIEYQAIAKDGSKHWITLNNQLTYTNGKPDGALVVGHDITEHKQAEKELRESREIYRHLVEGSGSVIIRSDMDMRITFINNFGLKFFGYSRDELIGKKALGTIIPFKDSENNDLTGMADDLMVHPENYLYNVHQNMCKDGRFVWMSWANKPMYDTKGNLIELLAIGNDISELKNTEQALRASEERHRLLSETMLHGVVYQAADGKIISINPAGERILGRCAKDLISVTSVDLEHGTIREDGRPFPGMEHPAMVALRTGKPITGTAMGVFNPIENSYRWISIDAIPIFRPGQSEPCQVYTVFEDITKRKLAEQELKESNEKLEIALENGNIGTWTLDFKTNLIILDQRTYSMLGFTTGSLTVTYNDFERCLLEEDLPHTREAIRRALQENTPFEAVYRIKCPNGNIHYINSKALIVCNNTGKPIKLTGVCFDITEMKKGAEQVIINLNEELLRSNRDLQQFAYVASHDLQEPLRMVSSFTQMLAMRYEDKLDHDGQEYIKYAVEGSKRMYDLINGLLAYSRVDTKGKEFEKVKMNDVLEKVLKNLSLRIEEKNALIKTGRLPVLLADESQMIQLVQNLVENSLKFSFDIPRISVTSKAQNEYYIFSIKDEGIGIDQQYFERIFKIFQRLHTNDAYEGTGIGLAICKRIVERHRGKIWVESEPGHGSTFYFTIPRHIIGGQTIFTAYALDEK